MTSSTYWSASPGSAAVRTQPWTWSSSSRIDSESTAARRAPSAGGCRRSTPRARSSGRSRGPGPPSGTAGGRAGPCPSSSCGGSGSGPARGPADVRRGRHGVVLGPAAGPRPSAHPTIPPGGIRRRPARPGLRRRASARLAADGPRPRRDGLVRARQRGGDGPDPRLLRGPLGVRAAHLPDPLEPRWGRGRELLARLLPARARPLPRDDDAPPEARPQEEPQAAPAARAVPGPHDQALLRARLPGADAQVRPAGARRRAVRHVRPGRAAARGTEPQPTVDVAPRRRRATVTRRRSAPRAGPVAAAPRRRPSAPAATDRAPRPRSRR